MNPSAALLNTKTQSPREDLSGASDRGSGVDLLSHGRCRSIIGAKAFHGPVRDGKAWDHLAIDARHKLSESQQYLLRLWKRKKWF